MLKKVVLLCMLIFVGTAYSSQRVVVSEEFTGTWCTYCPGAARALDEMYERAYDSLVVISYHLSDAFSIPEGSIRANYYGVSGIPHTRIDGIIQIVGGLHTGTIYPTIRKYFYQRIPIESPLEIELECSYGAGKDSGTVGATIINTSTGTVTGTLQFAIVENPIEYYWQGMSELNFVARDMLPDANGEAVSIPPGDTLTSSREFSIESSWNEENCWIVAFVQAPSREIYQGAWVGVTQRADMQYYGLSIIPENQYDIFRPGDFLDAKILAKNFGTGEYDERTILRSDDSLVKVVDIQPMGSGILPGDVDTVLEFTAYAEADCPDPHQTELILDFRTSEDTIPILVTSQFGFSDDFESGSGGWTHFGIRDYWHVTEHESYSSSHSWYCGIEGSWLYIDENDASLVTPYFVATPDTDLTFMHKYRMENSYDYGFIEIDNGSGWWKTLGLITGGGFTWGDYSYPLDEYALQTARLRYRFISDYDTHYEGWYIDDVSVPVKIFAVEEEPYASPILTVTPTLVRTHAYILFKPAPNVKITVHDILGREVRTLPTNTPKITWDCSDENGNRVPGGVYFVRLSSESGSQTTKLVVINN